MLMDSVSRVKKPHAALEHRCFIKKKKQNKQLIDAEVQRYLAPMQWGKNPRSFLAVLAKC